MMLGRWLLPLLLPCATVVAQRTALQVVDLSVRDEILDTSISDFDGDGLNDVFVLTKSKRIALHLQHADGARFGPPRSIPVPPGTAAVAIADLLPSPGDEIVLLSATGLTVLDVEPGKPLVASTYLDLPLVFPPGYSGEIRFWGWGEDLDGDGAGDLLLPGLLEDVIVFGGNKGSGRPRTVAVPSPASERLQAFSSGVIGVRRTRPRVAFHRVLDRSGFSPVFMSDQGLMVMGGGPRSKITREARLLIPIKKSEKDPLDILQRLDVTLDDLNRDGLSDLIVARTRADTSSSSFEQRTQLLFFMNGSTPSPTPTQIIVLPGVLSNGPHLRDLDGDGRKDLIFSLYGGKLSSNIARLVLRNVRLEYHVYLGRDGATPFARSPDLTLEDRVPLDCFDTWNLRHRLYMDSDWTGDRLPDLIRISRISEDVQRLAIHPAALDKGPLRFAEDAALHLEVRGEMTGYTHHRLAANRPAVLFTSADRLQFVTLKRP